MAQLQDELEISNQRNLDLEYENNNLHQLAQENDGIRQENDKLSIELAQTKVNEESLQKSYDYYKDYLIPSIEEKYNELQNKIKEIQTENQILLEENKNL